MISKNCLLLGTLFFQPTGAFVVPKNALSKHVRLHDSTLDEPEAVKLIDVDPDELLSKRPPRSRGPEMSIAIPFLQRPAALDGELAGDVGFDPLNFATNREALWEYREAEIKHARLAMLAAAGWPISELADRSIAESLGLISTLDGGDRVPSLLNGGLDRISPLWWGFCLGLTAAIDLFGVQVARAEEEGYIPGDLGFDPLGLYPSDNEGQGRMQLAEIKHGRVAMLGVTGFAIQEYTSKMGVVDETPFFFFPITRNLGQLMNGFSN